MESKLKIRIGVLLFTLILFLGIGTVAYHELEDWGWTDSFYFSATTLTTVGYGDLYPTTNASKIFTSIYILIGVGIVFSTLTLMGLMYLEKKEKEFVKLDLVRTKFQSKRRPKKEVKLELEQKKLEV